MSGSGAGSVIMHKDSVSYSPEVRDNDDNNAFTNPMYENCIDEVKMDVETIEIDNKTERDEQV